MSVNQKHMALNVTCQVITETSMKVTLFWDVAPCNLVKITV
jgi:hypothetical protein